MGQHELDKNAYVGVDEMYQNAASHTEYPMNTEHEQVVIDAKRDEHLVTEPDGADVVYADDEENDGDVPGTGEELDGDVNDETKPPGADNGFVQTEPPTEPISTQPLL